SHRRGPHNSSAMDRQHSVLTQIAPVFAECLDRKQVAFGKTECPGSKSHRRAIVNGLDQIKLLAGSSKKASAFIGDNADGRMRVNPSAKIVIFFLNNFYNQWIHFDGGDRLHTI